MLTRYDVLTEDQYFRQIVKFRSENNSRSERDFLNLNLEEINEYSKAPLERGIKHRKYLEKEFRKLILELDTRLDRLRKQVKSKSESNWFPVGILFATGKMEKYLKEHGSASKVSKNLYGEDSGKYRLYISSSALRSKDQRGKDQSRNIYYCYDKMTSIIDHCKKNNIDITQEFIDKCALIKPI